MKEQKHIKKIEPIEIDLEYIEEIDSQEFFKAHSDKELLDLENDFKDRIHFLDVHIKESLANFIDIGNEILKLMNNKSFLLFGYKNVYDLMKKVYGFSVTTTKNYIAIAKRFADNYEELIDKGYSMSQLVEMSSMADYSTIQPEMTIQEIRAFKKEAEIEKRIHLYKNSYKDFFNKVILKIIRNELPDYYHDHKIDDGGVTSKVLKIVLNNEITNDNFDLWIFFKPDEGEYYISAYRPFDLHRYKLTEDELITNLKDVLKKIKKQMKLLEDEERNKLERRAAEQALKKEKLATAEKDDSFLILKNDEERSAYIDNHKNWKIIVSVQSIGYIFYGFKRDDFPFGLVWNLREIYDNGKRYYFIRRKLESSFKQLKINEPVHENELITFIRDYKSNYGKK